MPIVAKARPVSHRLLHVRYYCTLWVLVSKMDCSSRPPSCHSCRHALVGNSHAATNAAQWSGKATLAPASKHGKRLQWHFRSSWRANYQRRQSPWPHKQCRFALCASTCRWPPLPPRRYGWSVPPPLSRRAPRLRGYDTPVGETTVWGMATGMWQEQGSSRGMHASAPLSPRYVFHAHQIEL